MKEVLENKRVLWFWTTIEKIFIPKFKLGYTVNKFMQDEFYRRYKRNYEIVRNIPLKTLQNSRLQDSDNFVIYQGAVNEGRAFEQLIPAMQQVNCELRIYGKGNFFEQTKSLIYQYNVEDKVKLMGAFLPNELNNITPIALLGITIFDAEGMNQYYSLANRFFDYTMAGIPQICVNYPEYKTINDEYNIALLIDDVQPQTIATAINEMLDNKELYETLKRNCILAREKLNWQNEEIKLINYWNKIL
jgi:glycosyltransferase involved in cell wall biosynthesis